MKPIHVAVAIALLAAAGLLFFVLRQDSGARTTQRSGARAESGADLAHDTNAGPTADGSSSTTLRAGRGALSLKVAVRTPDGKPAAGAEVELRGRAALTGRADAGGRVAIGGLEAGFFTLAARKGNAVGALSFELDSIRDLGTLTLADGVTIRGKVVGGDGQPLAGAVVDAARDRMRATRDMMSKLLVMFEPSHVAATATSGEDGSYELLVPTSVRLFLRATAAGHTRETDPARLFRADVEGIDFHLFPAPEFSGTVVNEQGAPIPGATILVIDPMAMMTGRETNAEATADGDGRFRLAVTPPEEALLVVRATGYSTFFEETPRIRPGRTITLSAGFTLRLRAVDERGRPAPGVDVMVLSRNGTSFATGQTKSDGRLEIANVSNQPGAADDRRQMALHGGVYVPKVMPIGKQPQGGLLDLGDVELSLGGRVRGRVLDAKTKQPVRGAVVHSTSLGKTRMLTNAAVLSDQQGAYELEGVPLKEAVVFATHRDYASAMLLKMLGSPQKSGGPLFEPGRREATKDLLLIPAVVIEGVVLTPEGEPAAGAQVVPADEEQQLVNAMLGLAPEPPITDAEGRFALRGYPRDATIEIFAVHRGYGPTPTITAKAGGPAVRLQLATPVALTGRVVDSAGQPVKGASVTVEADEEEDHGPTFASLSGANRPGRTDQQGRYLLRNTLAGDVVVQVDHPDYQPGSFETVIGPGRPTKLPELVLQSGLAISGRVLDDQGKGLGGAQVFGVDWEREADSSGRQSASTRTDAEGAFSLKGLGSGKYKVSVSGPGWRDVDIEAAAGSDGLRISLTRPAKLTGKVTCSGRPVVGATVSANRIATTSEETESDGDVQQTDWDQIDSAKTGKDGSFTLDDLPTEEEFTLRITHDGYREKRIENVLAGSRPRHVTLETGVRVAGQVLDEVGKPLHRAQVEVFVDDREIKALRTDSRGRFEAGGLGEGAITLRVQESGLGLIVTEKIAVRAGDVGVRLTARRGESISGVLRDRAGKPVRFVSITAFDSDGNEAASTMNWAQDGAFKLQGLPRGTYRLALMRPGTDSEEQEPIWIEGVVAGRSDLEVTVE